MLPANAKLWFAELDEQLVWSPPELDDTLKPGLPKEKEVICELLVEKVKPLWLLGELAELEVQLPDVPLTLLDAVPGTWAEELLL